MLSRRCNRGSLFRASGRLSRRPVAEYVLSISVHCFRAKSTSADHPPDIDQVSLKQYRNSLSRDYNDALFWKKPWTKLSNVIRISGYIGKRVDVSSSLSFAPLYREGWQDPVQLVSRKQGDGSAHQLFKSIKSHSAVAVRAQVERKYAPKPKGAEKQDTCDAKPLIEASKLGRKDLELVVESVTCLATFPEDTIVSRDSQFSPESRHLQIRFDRELSERLKFRSRLTKVLRQAFDDSFTEVETPILFKSTPEGAREFLVPTRRPGYAYALPQSPQQYKQILMNSGLGNYYQFAKCFRDEDLRADRQPEFTQLDIEMPFSSAQSVMVQTEHLIKQVYKQFPDLQPLCHGMNSLFPKLTYEECMNSYGVDKPDLRIRETIHRFENYVPESLKSMMTSVKSPIIEEIRFHISDDPNMTRKFIKSFMDSPAAKEFQENSDGPPGVFIYDPTKPLEGLQAFGFEGLATLQDFYDKEPRSLEAGDLILLQARQNTPHAGGSTALGRLRTAIHRAAVSDGLRELDPKHYYLWVVDFPLFTPSSAVPSTEPGQGGASGFSATHHPFTAPKEAKDLDLLFTDPLRVTAAHYDIVVNGVELGGGSRRIHDAEIQQYVMRDVLKMSAERMKDFEHLFQALRAGCPPHAGIALGLDRWVAVLTGRESVRDVIAFPKGGKGEDPMVGSPSLMTKEQQNMYHISVKE